MADPVAVVTELVLCRRSSNHPPEPARPSPVCGAALRGRLALASDRRETATPLEGETFEALHRELAACDRLVGDEGFVVRGSKTRVMRAGRRQEVTGVVVNDKPGVRRSELRKFRATLFQIERDGPAGKRWGHGPDLFTSLAGFASFVAMVDPAKGKPLMEQVGALAKKHGHRAKRTEYPAKAKSWERAPDVVAATSDPAAPAAAPPSGGDTPTPAPKRGKWWQFWKE